MAKRKLTYEEKIQEKLRKQEEKRMRRNERKARSIDSRPFAEISSFKIMIKSRRRKRVNRSRAGDIILFIVLGFAGILSVLPLVLIVSNAFKPLDEIFLYPPNFIVRNPTLNNFRDLGIVLATSLVPFSRYFFNTVMITIIGTVGHLIIASMCAYPLAKYKLPGNKFILTLITYSLMFPAAVTAIPHFLILNWFGLINTHWSIILPVIASSLGLYLMRQTMVNVPTSLLESAKLDGAGEFTIYRKIVMPLVKPASITLIILNFRSLWGAEGAVTIFSEQKKMLSYALSQIATAGPARQGTLAAVSLIMITVPIIMFIVSQNHMIDTMAHSGMK
ncbi:MAG TPA: carbohydrate ABC transporter permease [Bacilli bacterium]|jgi:ABC-type glycerol-3-phosphate transport system permease component|nr:carbohydrate ABC transporter permease [Bacilli bacterium]HPZ26936.1 carbohydrate ABC transporter permease [Bacilli bacterium]HQC89349.1 carbohydrate ABC transporter permease [Bacilli bacterium]